MAGIHQNIQEEYFSFPDIEVCQWKEVSEFVKHYGCSTSVALLDPKCEIYSDPHIEGIIGYRTKFGCAVVLGDPLCASEHRAQLIESFQKHCDQCKKKIIYTSVSKNFTKWALDKDCGIVIEVVEEFFLQPQKNLLEGSGGRKLRTKVKQALNAAVTIHEYIGHQPEIEKALEEVAHLWLKARHGPQIFLAHVDLFSDRNCKRWFYAKQEEKIVGVLLLNQLANGWVLNLLMTSPTASNGTSELLVVSMMEILQKEGCESLSLGAVILQEAGEIIGLGSLRTYLMRFLYKMIIRFFHLQGRRQYWKKFQPRGEPCYLIFNKKKLGISEALAVLRSINSG